VTSRSAPPSGPTLFARYAYGPNRLGYCGPDAVEELFGEATRGGDDVPLRALAREFDGAWPYLELIARANDLADPLDRRVVEAYWLGNSLLERAGERLLADSLAERFRPRLRTDAWRWLREKPAAGAVPVHAFHVFDVFPRIGLLRSGSTDGAVQVMESCRIRWGRVLERDGDWLVVNVVPLVMAEGRLALGSPRVERVQAWHDRAGFIGDVLPGDVVSVHWSWACDRLSRAQLAGLVSWTSQELAIANLTV
jgi:Family of unknown function (DUF6390)